MTRFLLLTLFLFYYHFSSAQSDSLSNYANKLNDKELVTWLVENFDGEEQLKVPAFLPLINRAVQLAETQNLPEQQSALLRFRGMLNYYDGNFENALADYLAALKIAETIDNASLQAKALNELSVVTLKQKKYAKAIDYLDKSYLLLSQLKDTLHMSTALDNKGIAFMRIQQLDSAEQNWNQVLALRLAIADSIGLGYIYNNLAWLAAERGQVEQAVNYIRQSTDIRQQLGDIRGSIININNIGETYASNGQTEKGLTYFERSLAMLDSSGITFPDFRGYLYQQLANNYAKLGNYQKAYDFVQQQNTIQDSLLNERKQEQLSELEVKYETAKKDEELQREKANLAQARLQNALLIAGLLILLLLAGGGYLLIRSRQKQKLQASVLAEKERGIAAVIEATENERKQISRELHDSAGQQMAALRLTFENIKQQLPYHSPKLNEQLQHYDKLLADAAQQIRSISHQMMPRALSEQGLSVAIEELLNTTLRYGQLKYDFAAIGVDKQQIDSRIALTTYRIMQELLNNAVKHASAQQIDASLRAIKNNLILTVEDDGVGFDMPTHQQGHGLLNMKTRLSTVNGTIAFEPGSAEAANSRRGTLATVKIPLN